MCAAHPDCLADTIPDRIVKLAIARDEDALVGVEVALHRNVVFVDGRIAAGRKEALVVESEIVALARQAFADAGYGKTPSGVFPPDPQALEVGTDLCLGPLNEDERAIRDVRTTRRSASATPSGPPGRPPSPRAGARLGGGATFGKDPRKVDPRSQALAREMVLEEVCQGSAKEATIWLAYRPGDLTPAGSRWS